MSPASTTPQPAVSPIKFLLVDDHAENLTALDALLERPGLELLKARTGEEALELLLAHEISLALLDVNMPGMDGFTLAELMRGTDRSRHIPIIFVTADPTEQHRIFQGYDAGAVDFLVKPLDPRILRHKVGTFFELARQRQEISSTLRMNEMFAAEVGHDLKNPLNAIVMTSELIVRLAKDPAIVRHATRLHTSSMRMARMVDDLFDLSRARLGQGIPIERKGGDLLAHAKRAIADHETAKPERALRFEHEGDTAGDWDGARLEQVVSNLVGNALQHGAPDKPVDVSLRGEGPDVVLTVHNEGFIPPAILPNVFDPFRSGAPARSRKGGLGLGLYIVRQIVIAHGGRVDLLSSEEHGTTITVRLPRKAPPSPEA